MPLYEYECDACGQRFEVIRKFSDPPLEVCTKCGNGPVRRLPSSPAIQFKGSGFYITDYGKKGDSDRRSDRLSTEQKQDAKSDAAAAGKVTKTEGKTESAAKTETTAKTDTTAKSGAPAKSEAPAKPTAPSATTGGGSKDKN
jgi:putative FmdB family regulatory protein